MTADVVPVRSGDVHFNVLQMLEGWACTNCIGVEGVSWSDDGNLLVDISIRHPYATDRLDLVGRDVRGVAIFPGTTEFPYHSVRNEVGVEETLLASRYLLNPDGYTTHFNRETAEEGPGLFDYKRGKMTWPSEMDIKGNLHPFRYFYTHEYKQLFYPGHKVVETYELDIEFQEPFTFAYSVDASWNYPHKWPVTNPITDFDISANAREAFNISFTVDENTLTTQDGYAKLTFDVFDHQGFDSIETITIEAPDLFNGVIGVDPTTPVMVVDEMSRYTVTLSNKTGYAKTEDGGSDFLIVVEDRSMSIVGEDVRAYMVSTLPVEDLMKKWRPREGKFQNMDFPGPSPTGPEYDLTVIRNPQSPWAIEPGEPMLLFKDDLNERYIAYNRDFDQWSILAGYPGNPNSWLKPTVRFDAASTGGFGVVSASDVVVSGKYLVKNCTNMHKPGGLYSISWFTGSLDDPSPFLELAGDVSGGFGYAVGDPVYSLYIFDSIVGYVKPNHTSMHRIGAPYNDPMQVQRAILPCTANLSGNMPPFGVSYRYFTAMGIDDDPFGESNPYTVHVYSAENRQEAINHFSRELDVYKVNFSDPLACERIHTYHNVLLGGGMAWPALETPRIVDVDVLPAKTNDIYMGAGQYAEHNWVAVLYSFNNYARWYVQIFDIYKTGSLGNEWEFALTNTGYFNGHAYAMDVDPENFEIYVLTDDLPLGSGGLQLTCLEYY